MERIKGLLIKPYELPEEIEIGAAGLKERITT